MRLEGRGARELGGAARQRRLSLQGRTRTHHPKQKGLQPSGPYFCSIPLSHPAPHPAP